MDEGEIGRLRRAIREQHGLETEHLRSEHVVEEHCGRTLWECDVEVFHIVAAPRSRLVYAWSRGANGDSRRDFVILGLPSIQTAGDAVRVSIAGERLDT
jgi:hypothetical protein